MGFSDGPYYAVHKGREPGVYFDWKDCREQVENYSGNCYKKFEGIAFAEWFVEKGPERFKNKLRYYNVDWVSSGSEVENCSYNDELSDANDDCEPYLCGQTRIRRMKEEEEEEEEQDRRVCKYYIEGNCKFGRNCRFYHPPRSVVTRMRKDESKNHDENVNKQSERNQGLVNNNNNTNDSNSTTGSSPIKGVNNKADRRVCRYWTQGNCRFGSSCRFYHPAPTVPNSTSNSTIAASSTPTNPIMNSGDQMYYDNGDDYDSDEDEDLYGGNFHYGMCNSDVNMLLSYGVKPWEDDADDLLDFLHKM